MNFLTLFPSVLSRIHFSTEPNVNSPLEEIQESFDDFEPNFYCSHLFCERTLSMCMVEACFADSSTGEESDFQESECSTSDRIVCLSEAEDWKDLDVPERISLRSLFERISHRFHPVYQMEEAFFIDKSNLQEMFISNLHDLVSLFSDEMFIPRHPRQGNFASFLSRNFFVPFLPSFLRFRRRDWWMRTEFSCTSHEGFFETVEAPMTSAHRSFCSQIVASVGVAETRSKESVCHFQNASDSPMTCLRSVMLEVPRWFLRIELMQQTTSLLRHLMIHWLTLRQRTVWLNHSTPHPIA